MRVGRGLYGLRAWPDAAQVVVSPRRINPLDEEILAVPTLQYLAEIARQIGFVSAFLGGVAATFLATLVVAGAQDRSNQRIVSWAIGCAAAACVAFIVAVVANTMLAISLRPDAPASAAGPGATTKAPVMAFLSFMLGMYLLLGCVGLSGWLHGRRTGWMTAALAAIGVLLISFGTIG